MTPNLKIIHSDSALDFSFKYNPQNLDWSYKTFCCCFQENQILYKIRFILPRQSSRYGLHQRNIMLIEMNIGGKPIQNKPVQHQKLSITKYRNSTKFWDSWSNFFYNKNNMSIDIPPFCSNIFKRKITSMACLLRYTKTDLLFKERTCSMRSMFFPLRVASHRERQQINKPVCVQASTLHMPCPSNKNFNILLTPHCHQHWGLCNNTSCTFIKMS